MMICASSSLYRYAISTSSLLKIALFSPAVTAINVRIDPYEATDSYNAPRFKSISGCIRSSLRQHRAFIGIHFLPYVSASA